MYGNLANGTIHVTHTFSLQDSKENRQIFWYKSDLFRIKCVKVMGTSWNGNLKKAHERNVNYRGLSNLRNV